MKMYYSTYNYLFLLSSLRAANCFPTDLSHASKSVPGIHWIFWLALCEVCIATWSRKSLLVDMTNADQRLKDALYLQIIIPICEQNISRDNKNSSWMLNDIKYSKNTLTAFMNWLNILLLVQFRVIRIKTQTFETLPFTHFTHNFDT